MNINAINNSTPNFNGQIRLKGRWNNYLTSVFNENKALAEMVEKSESNLVAKMSRKKSSYFDHYHPTGTPLYRLTLTSEKQNPTFLDRVKSFLGLGDKVKMSKYYHSEDTTADYMNRRLNADKIKEKLYM